MVSDRIKDLRLGAGMTQSELGEISALEKQPYKNMKVVKFKI